MSEATREAILEALQLWTAGNQQGAVDRLRPAAEADELPALGLLAWFLHQLGEPHWREGVPVAEKAIAGGLPWVAGYYLGNMLNDQGMRARLPEFLRPALAAGWQFDPVAHAVGPYQQGDQATALALLELASGPWPWPESLQPRLERAKQQLQELTDATSSVSARKAAALTAIDGDEQRVAEQANTLETRTSQLATLLEQTTNAEVQGFFEKEATAYEGEATKLWRRGVAVLVLAASLAALPILIYYVGQLIGTDWFASHNQTAAHFAPAIALGAVAGVLLARSRGRDRARQRARDLSVALGTMFVYSSQISNEEERQRFLHEMGRTVIEAFLRQEAPSGDSGTDTGGLLSALVRRA